MATSGSNNQVVLTPIFWAPTGYSFTTAYKNVIMTYLNDVAADSDKTTNVFATNMQYDGSNGSENYRVSVGTAINDTTAYPAAGCTTNAGQIYADNSAYATCIDNAQMQTEITSVRTANSLANGLGHMYLLFFPKSVETCYYAGNPGNQQCSINPTASSAFCAYHTYYGSSPYTVYANMPFPIYKSATFASCTDEALGASPAGTIQQPNGDPDGDVEVSPLSHEMSEAFTDPLLNAWYDVNNGENGDDCAYIYGTLGGSAGTYHNQTINGHSYLTQEEFSNANFVPATSGCLQQIQPVTPTVTSVSPGSGAGTGGTTVTIAGTGFPGASAVKFGATSASFTIVNQKTISATAPPGPAGTVDVRVTTGAGTSSPVAADHFTYVAPPTVTSVSPPAGPTAGGTTITIHGTNFGAGASVTVGSHFATAENVTSATTMTAKTPAGTAGHVHVRVTTTDGTSAISAGDGFTYLKPPAVSGVSPNSGPKAGGTKVTVTGKHFVKGGTKVKFGTKAGTSVKVKSATTLVVHSPKHAKGKVDVRATTAGGTSAAHKPDRYTFT